MAPVTSVPREEVGGPRQGDLAGPLVLTLCPLLLCRMWQSAGHTFTQSPLKAESPRFVCVVSWPFKGKLLPQPPDFGGFHTLGFAGCGGTWVFLSQVGRSSLPSFGGSSPPPLPQLQVTCGYTRTRRYLFHCPSPPPPLGILYLVLTLLAGAGGLWSQRACVPALNA